MSETETIGGEIIKETDKQIVFVHAFYIYAYVLQIVLLILKSMYLYLLCTFLLLESES